MDFRRRLVVCLRKNRGVKLMTRALIAASLLALTTAAHASDLTCIVSRTGDGLKMRTDWTINTTNKGATLGTFAQDGIAVEGRQPLVAPPGHRPIWIARETAGNGMVLTDRDGNRGAHYVIGPTSRQEGSTAGALADFYTPEGALVARGGCAWTVAPTVDNVPDMGGE
jgi:hypothetical protein